MKIAIGAVVLCKLLISEPDTSKIITKESVTSASGVAKNNNVSSNNNFITGNNAVDAAMTTTTQTEVITEKHYSMVVGTVEEIRSAKYLKEISNTGKYKYETEEVLIVKTEELEKLIVNARSCGLAENLIVDEEKIKKEQAKIKEDKEKVVEPKKEVTVKPKKKNNTVKSKSINKNEEELEIIFLDQPVPEGYEEVKDESLTKKVSDSLGKKFEKEKQTADEKYLQDLMDKQENERHVKKEDVNVAQPVAPVVETDTKVETQKVTTSNDDDLDVVKILEEQKMKENAKPIEVKKEIKVVKKEVIKKQVVVKKEEPTVKKHKITPDNFEPSGSVMKDVLDIISN